MIHPPTKLVLVPLDSDTGLEDVPVDTLPFMIGRMENIFGEFKDRFPERFNTLSRKHARILMVDSTYHLQDLKSTNGTMVSGNRLAEDAVPLSDGDKISFGDYLVYQVRLYPSDAKTDDGAVQQPSTGPEAPASALSSPDESRTLIEQGDSYFRRRDFDQALKAYQAARKYSPENEEISLLIRTAEKEKRKEKQFRKFEEEGNAHFEAGAFSQAMEAYKKALEIRPDSANAKEQYGKAKAEIEFLELLESVDRHLEEKEIEQATTALEKARKIKNDEKNLEKLRQRLDELKATEDRFRELTVNGDRAMEDQDCDSAAKLYQEA